MPGPSATAGHGAHLHRRIEPDDLGSEVAGQVAFLREEHGWTVEQLAQCAGIDAATVARIEAAADDAAVGDLLAVAHAFGYSGAELLLGVPQWMRAPPAP